MMTGAARALAVAASPPKLGPDPVAMVARESDLDGSGVQLTTVAPRNVGAPRGGAPDGSRDARVCALGARANCKSRGGGVPVATMGFVSF